MNEELKPCHCDGSTPLLRLDEDDKYYVECVNCYEKRKRDKTMKITLLEKTNESVMDENLKGEFSSIILEFRYPDEFKAYQNYLKAVQHPNIIAIAAEYLQKSHTSDPPMESNTSSETKN